MDQLRQDVGNMVEKITKVIAIFRQFQLKMEEYVCLKVIAMVSQDGKIGSSLFLVGHYNNSIAFHFHRPQQPNIGCDT